MEVNFTGMKNLLTFILFILASLSVAAQEMTLDQWNEEAKTNIRCLPKYGYAKKTIGQLEADSEFVNVTLPKFANKRLASEHLIDLGFKYLYHDIKTAMYRFNQAYLLDSTNSDIYWGYGGVYMVLQDYPRAREQYEDGLLCDSLNTNIMTDYGTWFVVQNMFDSAIQYLSKSYKLDSTNQNTSFKLAAIYFYKEDCKNALYYYEKCKALGGKPLTKEFEYELLKKCKFLH
jgi:tetratricopeptide (TPR) repeat protein